MRAEPPPRAGRPGGGAREDARAAGRREGSGRSAQGEWDPGLGRGSSPVRGSSVHRPPTYYPTPRLQPRDTTSLVSTSRCLQLHLLCPNFPDLDCLCPRVPAPSPSMTPYPHRFLPVPPSIPRALPVSPVLAPLCPLSPVCVPLSASAPRPALPPPRTVPPHPPPRPCPRRREGGRASGRAGPGLGGWAGVGSGSCLPLAGDPQAPPPPCTGRGPSRRPPTPSLGREDPPRPRRLQDVQAGLGWWVGETRAPSLHSLPVPSCRLQSLHLCLTLSPLPHSPGVP